MTNAQKKLRDLRHDAPCSFFMEALNGVINETECDIERAKLQAIFWAFAMTSRFRGFQDRVTEVRVDEVIELDAKRVAYHLNWAEIIAKASQEPANS